MKKESTIKLFLLFTIITFILAGTFLISADTITPDQTNADAAAQNIKTNAGVFVEWTKEVTKKFKESTNTENWWPNTTRLLLGVLLWMILYSIVKEINFFKGKALSIIASVIMTILSFMFIGDNFLNALTATWGPLGATILTILPFIIISYFTIKVTDNLLTARIIWIVFLVYWIFTYVGLMLQEKFLSTEGWIYFGVMALGILIIIFLEPIRSLFFDEKTRSLKESAERKIKKSNAFLEVTSGGLEEFSDGGGI